MRKITIEMACSINGLIATEQVVIPNAGHINSESGYDTFEDIVSYL